MSPALSIAASLSPDIRQDIGIQALARTESISHLAAKHQVSRKFVYQQGNKAQQSLDETFAPTQSDDNVLFHLPVTKNWLYRLILGLVLICHSSYRGVVELYRDLFRYANQHWYCPQSARSCCGHHRRDQSISRPILSMAAPPHS